MITIFSDGSSRGNPGPGGWGSVVLKKGMITELGGREDHTTNNRMELRAAIEALYRTDAGDQITVNTDSSYVINGITKWVKGWKQKGWVTVGKKEVVNRDLWEELDKVSSGKNVSWNYVGGHRGIAGNERCDVIATSYADKEPVELFSGPVEKYFIPNLLGISVSSENSEMAAKKSSSKSRSSAPAYSYVSYVDGVLNKDKTWKECEARVKGKKGAKYKKALSRIEEAVIVSEFTGK